MNAPGESCGETGTVKRIMGSEMIQNQLRFHDVDRKEEVGSVPLDKLPMIPRKGEVVVLFRDSVEPAEYEVTAVRYAYDLSPVADAPACVVLEVKPRKPPEYGLTTYLQGLLAKGR